MKSQRLVNFILALCAFFVSACADSMNLLNYKILELRVNDEIFTAPKSASFNLENEKIYGNAGCNNYFASIAWRAQNELEISAGGSTRMMCAERENNAFESAYLRALNGIFNIEKRENQYIIKNERTTLIIEAR